MSEQVIWSCGYCDWTSYEILNNPEVNHGIEYAESKCCHRRYSLDQLYKEVSEDNIN